MCPSINSQRASSSSNQKNEPSSPGSSMSTIQEGTGQQQPQQPQHTMADNESLLPPPTPLYPPNRVFSKEQLDVLNILVHPVWVFDIDHQCMRWANTAAVELWNASSLEDLLARDFSDMTESTVTRLQVYQSKFNQGQRVTDQWTFYPKGEAKTARMSFSGIRLSAGEPNPSMLCEGVTVMNEELHPETLRGVEMLRHLPVPVCQFDMDGNIMFKNPEGTLLLGNGATGTTTTTTTSTTTTGSSSSKHSSTSSPKTEMETSSPSSSSTSSDRDDFVSRFVDPKLGEEVLLKMQQGRELISDSNNSNNNSSSSSSSLDTSNHNSSSSHTLNIQANMRTRNGHRWSAVQLRQTSDPVTGKPVILYSSRDMSDAIQAQKDREASIKKSEFLAIMAHEIRTPLHQVTGFIDLLDQTELDTEQRSFVKLLKSSAQGLMTVINDVLDYSKLEAGKMKLETIPYEPRSVLEGSMAAVRGSCEEKKLYLKMDWDKDIPFKVMGDPNRVRQILLNLLSNAVKFTNQGGIQIKAYPWKSDPIITASSSSLSSSCRCMIKFVVTDTGRGITDEHKRLIFNQYQQGSASVARNFGGTGLGLSICKLLVQNMGGSIGVYSLQGNGSSFWFTLPAEAPSEGYIGRDELDASFRDEAVLHILVAEDNKVNQKLLANMLKRMGHTCEIAMNGKQAIEMLEQNNPCHYDVVLMDIQMPVMDGLEATRRIRSMGHAHLPIFGLTASVARSDFAELGFDDWLPKPIPMKELRTKLYRIQSPQQQQIPETQTQSTQ